MKRLKIYWFIWYTIATHTLQETFLNRWTNALFLSGKAIRFGMFLFFLLLIRQSITLFAGYTPDQVVIIFLVYQFVDTLTQVFFRGVYTFSGQVRNGELDFYLSKPINPLFRILTGQPDLIDAFFLIPTTLISFWIIASSNVHITGNSIMLTIFLLVNSFLIATGFHILVICLGILTTEVDNTIMLYRDLSMLNRFPINIYREPLRSALFFILPIGLMITIPAQVLMNITPSLSTAITVTIGVVFFLLSLQAWKWSIKRYTSAGG